MQAQSLSQFEDRLDASGCCSLNDNDGTQRSKLSRGNLFPCTVRVPLKFVIVFSLCFFTAVPALVLWLLSWHTGSVGLNRVRVLGQDSVQAVSLDLRSLLVDSASSSIGSLIESVEALMNFSVYHLQGDGSLRQNGLFVGSSMTALNSQMDSALCAIKAHSWMSMFQISLYSNLTNTTVLPNSYCIQQDAVYARMGLAANGDLSDYIYLVLNEKSYPQVSGVTAVLYAIDQVTGARSWNMSSIPNAPTTPVQCSAPTTTVTTCSWYPDLLFHPVTGIPQIYLDCRLPFADTQALYDIVFYANSYTLSAFLLSLLSHDKERLFLAFRSPAGTLVGASHGKFFSHSDIDYSKIDPIKNPPPVADFRTFNGAQSTDPMIREASLLIMKDYQDWSQIPPLATVLDIGGEPYWIVSKHLTSEYGLRLHLFLLVSRESKLGPIERSTAATIADIDSTNRILVILFCVVIITVTLLSIGISLLLTRPLGRLASGMNLLSMLDFDDNETAIMLPATSRFTEVLKCESSFVALERGLKAFAKYVPKEVVKMMLSGEMESENVMIRRVVTILFMDIIGFSALCEKISPDNLMKLTTDYLSNMCAIIVESGGTLDKFIGDCIMAMWNAPRYLTNHESAACGAALDMQVRLIKLCDVWEEESLPRIKFRVGINTSRVLVGNFGCDYRINYTCLGDGVNLASRLEAANKPFGTVVLVSNSTRMQSTRDFFFRKIGHITVPGKSEILPVFELLCRGNNLGAANSQQQPNGTNGENGQTNPSVEGNDGVVAAAPMAVPSGGPAVLFHWALIDPNTIRELAVLYEKGIEEFLHGNLIAAENFFLQALRLVADDGPSQLLLEQCRQVRNPLTTWDGVIRFDKK